jgi:two-component system, OmpR family, sensor histidine kinase KdpD
MLVRPMASEFALAALSVLIGVAVAAIVASVAERWLDAQSLALFFVVPIIIVAIRHGLWASLGVSLLSALAVNFLFVEPRYTFVVARPQDAAALVVFAIVAALSSAIAARARAATRSAEQRAQQATLLQTLAGEFAASRDEDNVASTAAVALGRLCGGRGLVVTADERHWGEGFDETARLAARWAMATKQPFKPAPDAPYETSWRFWPIVGGSSIMAVGVDAGIDREGESAVEHITGLLRLALARVAAADSAERARLDVERERLKSDLLAGVSHDLRTPLATILFNLQSLQRFAPHHPQEAREELLRLAEHEARRLSDMVEALLDASRIGTDGAPVRVAPVAPRALIARALDALDSDVRRNIAVDAPEDLPLVTADADLAARALANVIANAIRHGGGATTITATRDHDGVRIEVRDRGAGLGPEPESMFEPFVRGAAGDRRSPGLGLGLSLARKFLEAQGASIVGANEPEGGARFTLRFERAADAVERVG